MMATRGNLMWPVRARFTVIAFAFAFALPFALPRTAACQQPGDAVTEAKRLRDAGQYAAAAAALVPYLRQFPDDAGVHWLNAQMLEWSGQRGAARREYERTLALTPKSTPAADSLARHAADLSSAWAGLGVRGYTDDQTLTSAAVALDAGRYVSDDVAFTGGISSARFNAPDESPALKTNAVSVQIGARGGHGNVSMGGDIGADRSSTAGKTIPIGDAWAALKLSNTATVAASISRAGYHWTTASIDTAFASTTTELSITRDRATGFAGKAAIQRETFGDGNAVRGAYVWLLVPVALGLRAGYAGEYKDALESRWDGTDYDPYYTPENVRIHSAIAEWSWHDFRNAVQANGGVGVSAHELAPYLLNPSGKQHGYTSRSFNPWNASITATRRVTYHMSLRAHVEHHETAFYHATSAQLGATQLIR